MDDLLRDFLTESAENLSKLDNDLVELERHPERVALLNSIFRTIHTIKGTCGFIGLSRLEGVAHAAESVLDAMRSGRLQVSSEALDDILTAVDVIKEILTHLEQRAAEPSGDDRALIRRLDHWLGGEGEAPAAATPDEPSAAQATGPGTGPATHAEAEPAAQDGGTPSAPDAAAGEARSAPVGDSTLRVGVGLLDKLMNLVGELALGRNQLIQLVATQDESEFAKPIQQLNRVTTDLLEAVMRTRMQPIGNAWTKLPRLVRDLAHTSGKQISLQMNGAETELDRQVLQAIQDPLTHMIRNSADHGIEPPATRRANGKPELGTVSLSARHEGGHVVIEIVDDGAGIDAAKVRRKAVERGLARADAVQAMSDSQVLRFIFEPGFSTADKVTNVSGRGVGMDVVRSNIEAIGGTVELASQVGRGTTVRIKIPLTLAIISALLVGAGGETFAVPQIGVVELVRVTDEQRHLVEDVHGARAFRLRDALLPLVHLHALLGLDAQTDGCNSIVVCQVGELRFGLVVDEVFDTQEIVVKPVGRLVKHLPGYAGCTITGDGRVIMILDTVGMAAMSRMADTQARDAEQAAQRAATAAITEHATESILLFSSGLAALQAVPLSLVARLEEFTLDQIEEADGRFLVQYRGSLIPLVPVHPGLDVRAKSPRPVIVFSDRDRTMGVAVDEIRDIVETPLKLERPGARPGVLGVSVIADKATEVIDTSHYLQLAFGDWFARRTAETEDGKRVLLVDDSRFFLGLLAPVLRSHGYRVVTAMDGEEALARLGRGERYDLVLSDIDMARMDGLTLAAAIRANPTWAHLTLVALTGRGSEEDRVRGLAAGFDHYLTKDDREAVLKTMHRVLVAERAVA